MRMRIKLLASLSSIAMLIGIPTSAQHLLGVFSGAVLQLDTQIESPAQNNNAQTLPEQQAGDTIQFQLFAPDGGGRSTNGFTVELDMPGRTFSSYIGDMSGTDWNGAALVIRGQQLSALFITGATVPSSGYLGQVDLRVSQALEAGATLAVKSLSMTSGREVDQLNVSKAKISFTAVSACPGDFDNSGSVDLADFLAFAGAFGTSSSDANYDARSDLDGSGSVDLADFLLFAGVFGTTCPTDPEPPPKTPPPDGSIATWNLPQHAVARLGKGTLSGRSYAIAYSPDGSRLAVGSHVGIWLYDAGNWEEQALLSGHTGQVISVAFSPDGTKVASGSSDRTVRVWDLEARTEIAQLQGHTDNVTTVAYSPDGSTIASGSADGTVRLWDVAAKTQIISHDPGLGYIYAVAFSPDGTKVASSHSGGGVVRLWDVASHRLITERPHGTAASVAFSPDGSIIGLSRTEGSLGTADFSLWNYARDNYGAYWDDASSGTYSLAFSPDGSTFAVGPTQINYTVDIWRMQPDLSSVTSVSSLEGHTGAVTSLAFSRDGSKLAAVDSWNTVRVWDLQTETQTTVSKFPDTVYSIAVSPDGSTIASGVYGSTSPAAPKDKTVRLWDTATHTEIAQLQGHSEIVFSVAFSPDGSRIASGSKDGTVRLWDTTTQSETAQLRGHTETVFSVAF
ncbi:MAG: hypothetical protein OXR72_17430, partial [Gemmatimonadota bacterium]|nr:hypothetical protein [Gemmatimonadota bacterium]